MTHAAFDKNKSNDTSQSSEQGSSELSRFFLQPAAAPIARLGVSAAALLAAGVLALGAALTDNAAIAAPPDIPQLIGEDGVITFADLVERVSPTVVSVYADGLGVAPGFVYSFGAPVVPAPPVAPSPRVAPMPRVAPTPRVFGFDDEDGWDYFFDPRADEGDGRESRRQAQGSGFIFDAEGHIITNSHVVRGGDNFRVRLNSGEDYDAILIGVDPETDIAVLKVKTDEPLPSVEFAPSANLRVGDLVLAMGNPFGIGATVTSGIVSAKGRNIGSGPYTDYIQIDAPINRGNSGGPAFDLRGRVVGVNTAIFSPNGGNVGIGFAIPSDMIRHVVDQLVEDGVVERGWLGVSIQAVTARIQTALDLDEIEGVIISDIVDDSPAERAGLERGDVIVALDGEKITSSRELTRMIATLGPDKRTNLKVWREGREKNVRVVLGARPDQRADFRISRGVTGDELHDQLGFRAMELDRRARRTAGLEDGETGALLRSVRPGGAAAAAGLRSGDIVLEVDRNAVSDAEELDEALRQAQASGKEAVLLLVLQRGERIYVAMALTGS